MINWIHHLDLSFGLIHWINNDKFFEELQGVKVCTPAGCHWASSPTSYGKKLWHPRAPVCVGRLCVDMWVWLSVSNYETRAPSYNILGVHACAFVRKIHCHLLCQQRSPVLSFPPLSLRPRHHGCSRQAHFSCRQLWIDTQVGMNGHAHAHGYLKDEQSCCIVLLWGRSEERVMSK